MATVALDRESFATTIDNNDVVLVDFWAEWCGPCHMFAPTFEAASEQFPDVVGVFEIRLPVIGAHVVRDGLLVMVQPEFLVGELQGQPGLI